MRISVLVCMLLSFVACTSESSLPVAPAGFSNALCPVTGEPIDTSISPVIVTEISDTQTNKSVVRRVGFHSLACKKKFSDLKSQDQTNLMMKVIREGN